MAHTTVAQSTLHEEVIEGSRFLAYVWPVGSVDEATSLLAEVRSDHPDATHHCFAFKLGEVQRFSDDGEPGGTAGRPMLEVLLKRELDMVATVVVRYYGGKKLGAGGLVRAYSGSVSKALDQAGTRQVVDMAHVRVSAPFALTDVVLRTVDELVGLHPDSRKGLPEFGADGLDLALTVPAHQLAAATDRLTQVSSGAVQVVPAEPGNTAE